MENPTQPATPQFDERFRSAWDNDQWLSSPWNFIQGSPTTQPHGPAGLYDVTLRDGTQSANVEWDGEGRKRLAAYAAEVGIKRIEIGRAWANEAELHGIREVVGMKTGMTTHVLVEMSVEDMDRAADCGVDGATVVFPSCERMIRKWGKTHEQVAELAVAMIERARRHGLRVTLFPTYGSLATPAEYRQLISSIQARAPFDSLTLVDTLGVCTPMMVPAFLAFMRALTDKPLEFHFHNDFGLATANSLMALAHGASMVHTTFSGVGERAGNAAFEEVAAAARILLALDLGVDLTKLGQLPGLMREVGGFSRAGNAPITGESLFQIKLELIQRGFFQDGGQQKFHYGYPFHWNVVGSPGPEPVLGADASLFSVELALQRAGVEAYEVDRTELLARVRREVDQRKRPLTISEVAGLCD